MPSVVAYELRRGFMLDELRRGGSLKKRALFERLLTTARILGLDEPGGHPWTVAAELWASAKARKPAMAIAEADLLIAATALAHDGILVTSDEPLARKLEALGFGERLELLSG